MSEGVTIDPKEQAVIDKICELVSEGKTIREIAPEVGCSPGQVINRIKKNPDFEKQYAYARDAAADLFESDIYAEAMAVTSESSAASRVKIDALKWIAARRAPKKYGDRVDHTSSDGSMSPKPTSIELVAPDE